MKFLDMRTPLGGRRLLIAAALFSLLLAGVSTTALADSPNWKLADGSVTSPPGVATFDFAVPDKAHLLLSDSLGYVGDQRGKKINALFSVQGVTGKFTYGGQPSCGGSTANVRLYFESIPPGAKFAYTNYWWTDVAFAPLANTEGNTLTATIDPSQPWSDWNGQPSAPNPVAFTAAASNITGIGLSFGGGCFFENGVGTTDGSGSFTLVTFTVK